jgi:hypothetical protein
MRYVARQFHESQEVFFVGLVHCLAVVTFFLLNASRVIG